MDVCNLENEARTASEIYRLPTAHEAGLSLQNAILSWALVLERDMLILFRYEVVWTMNLRSRYPTNLSSPFDNDFPQKKLRLTVPEVGPS